MANCGQARRRAARRYASIGSGSAIFAAQPPTEARTNPPAKGTPAAAAASDSERAAQRTFRGPPPLSGVGKRPDTLVLIADTYPDTMY